MANRIIGNTYILDTASANVALPWPTNAKIAAVKLWSTDTTGIVELTAASTLDVLVKLVNSQDDDNTVGIYLGGVNFSSDIKMPTLTAGTAWVYFV